MRQILWFLVIISAIALGYMVGVSRPPGEAPPTTVNHYRVDVVDSTFIYTLTDTRAGRCWDIALFNGHPLIIPGSERPTAPSK